MFHTMHAGLVRAAHLAFVAGPLLVTPAFAQQVLLDKEDYLSPPAKIASILTSDAMHNRESLRDLGPDGEHFLVSKSGGMPGLARYARPYVNLGETAIDHRAKRSRRLSTGNTIGFELVAYKTGGRRSIDVPEGMTVTGASWSPDGKRVAFVANADDASYLYVADVKSGKSRQVTDRRLLATLVTSFRWTWDSKHLLSVLVRENCGDMPRRDPVAPEPTVWLTQDGKTPNRTYRFLLKTPYDKELLEYLTTGQLGLVDVATGKVTDVGKPAMFTSIAVGSQGRYFRVTTMQKPFSYFVPMRSFGTRDELWDRAGKVVHMFRERKLREGPRPTTTPRGGRGAAGGGDSKRSLSWRPDGKGMSFLQREPAPKKKPAKKGAAKKGSAKKKDPAKKKGDAKDGKTPKTRAGRRGGRGGAGRRGGGRRRTGAGSSRGEKPDRDTSGKKRKDRVMQWLPPYGDKNMKVVWESDEPIQSVAYSQDCQILYITKTKDGKRHVFAVNLKDPKKKLKILESKIESGASGARNIPRRFRRGRGGFGRGGGLMRKRGAKGGSIVRTSTDGKSVYMSGTDRPKAGEEGAPRPYIDRLTVGSGEKKRVWQSAADVYETLLTPTDDDLAGLILSRESSTMVPNSYLWERKTGELQQLTQNVDPAPEVTGARRIRFQVTRVDGFKFWARATIPRHYGQRLPAMFWFYPREFTSQKAYDARQRPANPNRFPGIRTRSMELLTTLGYVVVAPDCPIVGAEGRMNDNFVSDLRNSLWAVIDELDKRQIIDRDRLAIGGHSYGAFGTANALAHTPFFKAGIAGDGNYNRTLTPMAFQSERRLIWDARETYFRMSPLLWANQVNGALLMYHGMDDNNSGTFPIHSPRMFQALNGLGKKAALYMYPYEGHGPGARETILDLWARWVDWLDIHVKDPSRGKGKKKPAARPDLTEDR